MPRIPGLLSTHTRNVRSHSNAYALIHANVEGKLHVHVCARVPACTCAHVSCVSVCSCEDAFACACVRARACVCYVNANVGCKTGRDRRLCMCTCVPRMYECTRLCTSRSMRVIARHGASFFFVYAFVLCAHASVHPTAHVYVCVSSVHA